MCGEQYNKAETADFCSLYVIHEMDSSTSKSKHDRATHEQLEVYVAFCQAHPEIGTGKNSPKSPQQMQDLWKQVAGELNSCRGPTRTAAKWKETLGVWKSQLRTRARRLKMSQRLTGGGPSCKPMSEFDEKALATFGAAAVDGVKGIQSLGLTHSHEPLSVECPISPTESASSFSSPQPSESLIPQNPVEPLSPDMSPNPASSPSSSLSLANEDARASRLSRGDRSKLINTLIANIAKRNYAEEERQRIENERRQEHREVMQAIQGLTNTVAELVNVLSQNRSQ